MLRIPCSIVALIIMMCSMTVSVDSCDVDSDCGENRCCRPTFGLSNCGDLISEEGARCGAATLCGCIKGLKCVTDNSGTVWSALKRGNGTCTKDSTFHDLTQRFDFP